MINTYLSEIFSYRTEHEKSKYIGPRAPLQKTDLKGLRYFEVSKAYRLEALFTRAIDANPFEMATYSGETKPYRLFGTAHFKLDGEDHQLLIYQSLQAIKMPQYRDHLFLPFKDLTSGEQSYGGGRYLDLKQRDLTQEKLILDFNKAYNPWCAYSDGYSCPIPPAENHLEIAILAGEQKYSK